MLRWFVGLLSLLARRLPLPIVHRLGDALGLAVMALVPARFRLADWSLREVFGDRLSAEQRRRILSFSVRNAAKTVLELLRLPAMSEAEFNRLVNFENPEVLDQVAASGRGCVAVTAHFGNWELLAAAIARRGLQLVVLANDAPDAMTATIVNDARRSAGLQVVDRSQVRELFRALQAGCFLGILPDQRAETAGSLILSFLGRPALTYTGPATLALRTGAVVLPCFGRRTADNRIVCCCREPFTIEDSGDRDGDVRRGTEQINRALEREILRYPEQWLWLHNRWELAPGKRRGRRARVEAKLAYDNAHNKSEWRRRVERALVRLLTRWGARLVRNWPLWRIHRLGDAVGWLIFVLVRSRQRLADLRLQQVFGDRLTAAQRRRIRSFCTRNLTKTMLELLRLPTMTDEEFDQLVSVEGIEHLDQAMALGRGVIALSAHYGNWELLPRVMRRRGYPVNVVARTANDPIIANIIIGARESVGQRNLDRGDVRSMMRVLSSGGILGLMPDQYAVEGGVMVDFLGMPASTSPGPAVMALRTGAAIVPMFARRTDNDHIVCQFHPPIHLRPTGDRQADIIGGTQLINDIIGREILRRPGQWLWLHRRWRPQDWQRAQQQG